MGKKTDYTQTYLVFRIDDQLFGIDIRAVFQVVRAAALTPVPNGPPLLAGLLNFHGTIVPVIDIRKQLKFAPKSMSVNDRIIIVAAPENLSAAFICDDIEGILPIHAISTTDAGMIHPELSEMLSGVGRIKDKTILIYDINSIFPEQQMAEIQEAITDQPIKNGP